MKELATVECENAGELSCHRLMKFYSVLMSCHRLFLKNAVREGEFCTYCRHRATATSLGGTHDHDYYELFWVESGPGLHFVNGESREVRAGTVQLICPEDTHAFAGMPNAVFEFTNVTLFPETWRALKRRYFSDRVSYFDVKNWQEREFVGLTGYIGDFRAAAAALHAGARDRLALERFLLNFLALLPDGKTPEPPVPEWLANLKHDLQQQANFVRGISALVKRSGRCAEHVSREFRRFYGKTPTDEMNEARLRYAALNLRTSSVKIVDLALDLGIENLGYFYRLFSRHYGCTPAEYRRAHSTLSVS